MSASTFLSLRYAMEPMRTIPLASISNVYVPYAFNPNDPMHPAATGTGYLSVPAGAPNNAGQAPLLYPARQWVLNNNTNGYLYWSLNGIDDNGSLLPFQGFVNDISSNKNANATGQGGWALNAGDVMYVRWEFAAPTLPALGGEVTFSVSHGGV